MGSGMVSRQNRYSPSKKGSGRGMTPRRRRGISARGILIIIIVILLLLGAALAAFMLWPRESTPDDVEAGQLLPFSNADLFASNDEFLLYVKESKLFCIDAELQEKWSASLSFVPTSIVSSNAVTALYSEQKAVAFNSMGVQLFTKDLVGRIVKVMCGVECVGVLSADADDKLSLFIFDLAGNELKHDEFSAQTFLQFGFSGGSEDMLWTLIMDTEGSSPVSTITTYNIRNNSISITGMIPIDGQIPESLRFSGDQIFVVGTNNLLCYNYLGNIKSTQLVYGWRIADAFWNDKQEPVFAFVPRKDSTGSNTYNVVRLITPPSGEVSFNLPPDCFYVQLQENRFYCVSLKTLYVYDLSGELISKHGFNAEVSFSAAVFGNKYIIVEKTGGLFLVKLPK